MRSSLPPFSDRARKSSNWHGVTETAWMTLIGRDRPKSYERGVDNAATSASLRLQTGEWALHLEYVG